MGRLLELSMTDDPSLRAPWHLWVLGVVTLLYGLLAAYDSVQTLVAGEDYMRASGMTDAQLSYFTSTPWWFDSASFVSVWSGLLAAVALLVRKRIAALLYAVSAAATFVSAIYLYFLSDGPAAMGNLRYAPIVIGTVMALMALYAYGLAKRGVLT